MQNFIKKTKDFVYRVLFLLRTLRSNIFIFLSRHLLKNEAGLDLYAIGKLKHSCIRLMADKSVSEKLNAPVSAENSNVVPFLHENKYAPVDLHIPAETLQAISTKIHALVEDERYSYPRGQKQSADKKIHYSRAIKNLVQNIPEVKQVLTPELEALLVKYFGTNIAVTSVLCWRNYHVPTAAGGEVVYSNDWHNDNIAPTELKLFINMTDVTEGHGPLHVIGAPESRMLISRNVFAGRKQAHDLSVLEDASHIRKHTGKAGSAVFCHTSDCLHRADVPAQGNYRDMLEFQFRPSVKPLARDWERQALKYA